MKKLVSALLVLAMVLSSVGVFVQAVEVSLVAPTESEIAPLRDFYVVGKIDRGGKTAKEEPVNIRVNLINSKGVIVRSVESNVGPDGITPAAHNLNDYRYATGPNNTQSNYVTTITPPDIIYDGAEREGILDAYNKIVVKEDYFAAAIYGGASREFELKYEDKFGKTYTDLTQGEYELVVITLDIYGNEISKITDAVVIDNTKERIIASVEELNYAKEHDLVLSSSMVGAWNSNNYIQKKNGNFTYAIPERHLPNAKAEFENSKNTHFLLNFSNLSDVYINHALGSAVENNNNINFLYYDIGERNVSFDFAGETINKTGSILSETEGFIELCRAENFGEEINFVDFNPSDGVIITEDTVFYGVYSPIELTAEIGDAKYKLSNEVSKIKASFTAENGKEIHTENIRTSLYREDEEYPSAFEFSFIVTADEKFLSYENVTLSLTALDKDGEELLKSKTVPLKFVEKGEFIGGYDDNYWGKVFCDTVNYKGEAPSGNSLDPNEHILRGDFAAMVNRLLGYAVTGEVKFADLKKNSVFYNDCITAQKIGYMTGDENGNVKADDLISREQAMIILARISGAKKGETEVVFKDSDKISFWAKDYVDALCSTGIVSGFNGYINPTENITVAEAAALIIKTMKWMYSDEEVLPVGVGNNYDSTDKDAPWNDVTVSETDITKEVTEATVIDYFNENEAVFKIIVDYIKKNCPDGVSVKKVGNGLEIRNFKTGEILTFSDKAVDTITKVASHLKTFSIKYNPNSSDATYFKLGNNSNNNEVGVVCGEKLEGKGKTFKHITENWYFYLQK